MGFFPRDGQLTPMFEGAPYEARRRRTDRGFAYELRSSHEPGADGEPALTWTLHPYHLGDGVDLLGSDGEAVLRIVADDVDEYVAADFSVVDGRDGSAVGGLRWTLRSLFRREWELVDAHGVEVATVRATSRLRSTVRRRWLRLVPYRYAFRDAEGEWLGEQRGSIRPGRAFSLELEADPAGEGTAGLDPRLAVGACAVVDAAEFW